MRRLFLWVEYDGRPFLGWQRQDDGPTVQGVLEDVIGKFDPRGPEDPPILVYGSGRTDAGVHACGQVAHVDMLRDDLTTDRIQGAMNHYLMDHPVSILKIRDVPLDAHARFHAVKRHYRYKILCRRGPATFERGLVWHVKTPLDLDLMREGARHLVGHHDFTTFRHVNCQAKSPEKTLEYLDIVGEGERLEVQTGSRSFLHHQVRSMVGCLALVGMKRWPPERIKTALEARNRQALGLNAPSDGLYFSKIEFDKTATGPLD